MRYTFDAGALRRLRREAGVSARELAQRAKTTAQSVYMIERGATEPRAKMIAQLASALDVSILAFFRERKF